MPRPAPTSRASELTSATSDQTSSEHCTTWHEAPAAFSIQQFRSRPPAAIAIAICHLPSRAGLLPVAAAHSSFARSSLTSTSCLLARLSHCTLPHEPLLCLCTTSPPLASRKRHGGHLNRKPKQLLAADTRDTTRHHAPAPAPTAQATSTACVGAHRLHHRPSASMSGPSSAAPSAFARLAALPDSLGQSFTPSDAVRVVEVSRKYLPPTPDVRAVLPAPLSSLPLPYLPVCPPRPSAFPALLSGRRTPSWLKRSGEASRTTENAQLTARRKSRACPSSRRRAGRTPTS